MTCHFSANRVAGQTGHLGRATVSKLWYVKVMVRKTDTRGSGSWIFIFASPPRLEEVVEGGPGDEGHPAEHLQVVMNFASGVLTEIERR